MTRSMITLACILLIASCNSQEQSSHARFVSIDGMEKAGQLDLDYWYSGNAELSKYDLRQDRYGAIRDGEDIKIFVTEDFLTDKQVKDDQGGNPNAVSVLKMNDIRRFTTGIYDYSIMTSVFTRADGSATEKITLSVQDWCGQTYVQLNKKGGKYNIQLRSYFESEADRDFTLKADLLEDEVMNLIRIDPNLVTEGELSVLPSITYFRFTHKEHAAHPATITKEKYTGDTFTGEDVYSLKIQYADIDRAITIFYDRGAMNKILGWEETGASGNTTSAIKTHEVYDAYWQMNKPANDPDRSKLGLDTY